MAMISRFDSQEDNWRWAKGAWEEGATARIVHKQALHQAPTIDQVGQLAHDSWKAGWCDADMQLSSENEALESWQTKVSYDADNNEYHSIVGISGEHIATVRTKELAEYIVKAVTTYAQENRS